MYDFLLKVYDVTKKFINLIDNTMSGDFRPAMILALILFACLIINRIRLLLANPGFFLLDGTITHIRDSTYEVNTDYSYLRKRWVSEKSDICSVSEVTFKHKNDGKTQIFKFWITGHSLVGFVSDGHSGLWVMNKFNRLYAFHNGANLYYSPRDAGNLLSFSLIGEMGCLATKTIFGCLAGGGVIFLFIGVAILPIIVPWGSVFKDNLITFIFCVVVFSLIYLIPSSILEFVTIKKYEIALNKFMNKNLPN